MRIFQSKFVKLTYAFFGLIALAIGFVTDFFGMLDLFTDREINFIVSDYPVHLGDNYRANLGGDLSFRPNPTNCYSDFPSEIVVVCLVKGEGLYYPHGLTDGVIRFLNRTVRDNLSDKNLDAWQHIAAVDPSDLTPEEAKRAIFFDGGPKIWREGSGNYYARVAPFIAAYQISLFDKLSERGLGLDDVESADMTITAQMLTGGRRPDQDDQIYIFFGDEIRKIKFPSVRTRENRLISEVFRIGPEMLEDGGVLSMGFAVFAWQEYGPRPPENYNGDRRGPAHFQDIDISKVQAHLTITKQSIW